jgi:hypothetical protein
MLVRYDGYLKMLGDTPSVDSKRFFTMHVNQLLMIGSSYKQKYLDVHVWMLLGDSSSEFRNTFALAKIID